MTRRLALEIISDGHGIIKVEYAKAVCKTFGVIFPESLVQRWKSDKTGDPKGLTMNPGCENTEGVYSLDLSRYVAKCLGVANVGEFNGRGRQARAYAEAVEAKLKEAKK